MCTSSLPKVAFSILLLFLTVAIACTRKPTPEEVGRLLTKRGSGMFYVSKYECREGEKQWDYFCQVSHQPTPAAHRESKPLMQRVGVIIVGGTYKGEPLFGESPFPGEGPIPSRDEYPTWLRQVNQEAERKAAANRRTP